MTAATIRRGRAPHDPDTCRICSEIDMLLDTRGWQQTCALFGIQPASLRRHLHRHSHPAAAQVPWGKP